MDNPERSSTPRATINDPIGYQPIRSPRGTTISCKGWQQEAALRMSMNSLDPEIAEMPEKMIASGGVGKAARDSASFQATIAALHVLESNETLFVQAGKPAGVFRTHEHAPRILVADSDLAGSWTFIGPQGFLPAACEILAAAGRKYFGGDLAGKLVASGGMGGAGGAQPLAATMNGAAFLGIDADPERIKRRVKTGYCDVMVNDLDEALRILKNAVRKREGASVGLVGNCADVIPELARRGVVPDLMTDQTGARDSASGYVPRSMSAAQAAELREADPESYRKRALDSIALHVEGMLALKKLGSVVFDYGNHIGQIAFEHGVKGARDFPDAFSEYIAPALREGRAPIHWIALSGEPADIQRTDRLLLEIFPDNEALCRFSGVVQRRVRFQGLPARACWLAAHERGQFGAAVNDLVARGELRAPIAIVRNRMDSGSAASPDIATEAMRDGSVLDAHELNELLRLADGATWASIQRSGVEAGTSRLVGQVVVADGTKETSARIERVLSSNDLTPS